MENQSNQKRREVLKQLLSSLGAIGITAGLSKEWLSPTLTSEGMKFDSGKGAAASAHQHGSSWVKVAGGMAGGIGGGMGGTGGMGGGTGGGTGGMGGGRIGETNDILAPAFLERNPENTPGASSRPPPAAVAHSPRRLRLQHAAAVCASGAQHGVERLCALWTSGSGCASMALHGFAGAAASWRPV
jgi:hypothetical protein